MADSFGGAWLVTEYVHDPDGTFVGVVRQRRLVEQLDDGRLRVTQHCEPDAGLTGHPMAEFAGTWVFDLEVVGAERRYHGPDVIGIGVEWGPGAMTGSGQWPRFGHDFESYGVLVAPDRQLTGGFFSVAGRSVADIVGVAVPEAAGVEPVLDLDAPRPLPEAGWLHRYVGPMLVASRRTDPGRPERRWAMNDPVGGAAIDVCEMTVDGQPRTSITTPPAV